MFEFFFCISKFEEILCLAIEEMETHEFIYF